MSWEWTIEHNGHFAWFQRALMIGDLAPGLEPRGDFVVYADDRCADPELAPRCATCGEVPATNELVAIETATGDSHFLAPFRQGLRKWPKPTPRDSCWWCNTPRAGATGSPPLCAQCEAHLAGR